MKLPPLIVAGHLIDYLFQVGPFSAGEPISFQEIAAWTSCTGIRIDCWEAETLRAMSAAYAAEFMAATEPARPPPYRRKLPVAVQKAVLEKGHDAFADVLDRMEARDAQGAVSAPRPPPRPATRN